MYWIYDSLEMSKRFQTDLICQKWKRVCKKRRTILDSTINKLEVGKGMWYICEWFIPKEDKKNSFVEYTTAIFCGCVSVLFTCFYAGQFKTMLLCFSGSINRWSSYSNEVVSIFELAITKHTCFSF